MEEKQAPIKQQEQLVEVEENESGIPEFLMNDLPLTVLNELLELPIHTKYEFCESYLQRERIKFQLIAVGCCWAFIMRILVNGGYNFYSGSALADLVCGHLLTFSRFPDRSKTITGIYPGCPYGCTIREFILNDNQ